MSLPEKIGIESRITLYLPPGPPSGTSETEAPENVGKVRASFRISTPFPEGDWLDVEVVARVFDREYVERYRRTPENPIAEGVAVRTKARSLETVVDLVLPPMPFGQHPVVAKVYSHDDHYRKLFDPSNCYVAIVPYGYLSRIQLSELRDVYAGVGNPAAEQEIRRQVRDGAVIAEENGVLYRTREERGLLVLEALEENMFEFVSVAPSGSPIATGAVEVDGAIPVVAQIFARNGQLMASQLAPIVIQAAANATVSQRLHAMGQSPHFLYHLLGEGQVTGTKIRFEVSIYARP